MRALCIDPGSEKSALVEVDVPSLLTSPPWGIEPLAGEFWDNEEVADYLHDLGALREFLVVECMPTVFGGAAARDQLKTERWAGQFMRAFILSHKRAGSKYEVIEVAGSSRRAAVLGTAKGNDSMNRRALIDMYGGDALAFGKKCQVCKGKGWRGRGHEECPGCSGEGWDPPPGPLHGWTGTHLYAALGCAIAAFQPGGPGRPRSRAQELLEGSEGSGNLASTLRRPPPDPGGKVPKAPSLEELDRMGS